MKHLQFFNLIKLNMLTKKKYFYCKLDPKKFILINKFIELNLIKCVSKVKNTNDTYKIYFSLSADELVYKSIKLLYKPSKPVFVNAKTLREMKQYTSNSIYLLLTNKGLLTSWEAINQNIGGILFCQFFV